MRLARRLRYQRAEHDLGLGQLSVLATLDRHGAMTAGELAEHEQVRPPSMTKTIGCLLEAGYVTRTPSERDRRQVVVDLTPAARTLLREDRRRRDQWLAARLRALPPEQRATLAAAVPVLEGLAGT
jgi:DNA-binding MarR family transcriptional regulator